MGNLDSLANVAEDSILNWFIQHLFKTPQLAAWVWWFLFLRGFNTPQKKGAGFISNLSEKQKSLMNDFHNIATVVRDMSK